MVSTQLGKMPFLILLDYQLLSFFCFLVFNNFPYTSSHFATSKPLNTITILCKVVPTVIF